MFGLVCVFQTSRRFFVITFLGSIFWIGIFSYMMVWWAHQVGQCLQHITFLPSVSVKQPPFSSAQQLESTPVDLSSTTQKSFFGHQEWNKNCQASNKSNDLQWIKSSLVGGIYADARWKREVGFLLHNFLGLEMVLFKQSKQTYCKQHKYISTEISNLGY